MVQTHATHTFFATATRGVEELLAGELKALGANGVRPSSGGVYFEGGLALAYAACLWSRTASRVLLPLSGFDFDGADALYEGVKAIAWEEHLRPTGTLAVDFSQVDSPVAHTRFGAQRAKDGVVDRLRTPSGARPSVDLEQPDIRINIHCRRTRAVVSLDLSGESLHRRGYRLDARLASMKENLAAALLLLADWPRRAEAGEPFIDPMCGAGTLAIEAALVAYDVAPGLMRPSHGFERWLGHDRASWERLLSSARARDRRGGERRLSIAGFDMEAGAIRAALANASRAGLERLLHFERRELDGCRPLGVCPSGLLVVNPPYGERVGDETSLPWLYRRIGDLLKQHFPGWTGFVFTGNPDLAASVGLAAARRHRLFNGPIECRLLEYPITPSASSSPRAALAGEAAAGEGASLPCHAEAESWLTPFTNRLAKNLKQVRRWAEREGVTCYRLYDADLPEFAMAIDWYEGAVHVQEYKAPASIDPLKAQRRLHAALSAIPKVLEVPTSAIALKVRSRQRGGAQYERNEARGLWREVNEGGHRFWVNLTEYLDTGLFLDHRNVRRMVGELAQGRRFLNLFAYTAAATVYAAKGGARSTVTVDLSNTYLDWAERNFSLNKLRYAQNELVKADCLAWLEEERSDRFGLILLDVPTHSNSKSMEQSFEVQRDHVALIRLAVRLLEPGGVLLFSNNLRSFKLEREALAGLAVQELTHKTVPFDFARTPKIHNAWKISVPVV